MSKTLFALGNSSTGQYDYTDFVDQKNYKVQKQDVYEEWTDGNGLTHRVVTRQRISGTVILGFAKELDYTRFCTRMSSLKIAQTGSWPLKVYVNNTNEQAVAIDAFVEMSTAARWNWTTNRQWYVVTLNITER